jgi:hypothetical protein
LEMSTLFPPTLAYAFRAAPSEVAAWSILDHKDTIKAVKVNNALHAGQAFGREQAPASYAWPWNSAYWASALPFQRWWSSDATPGTQLHST